MVINRQNGINRMSPFSNFDSPCNFSKVVWYESSNVLISHESKAGYRRLEGGVTIQRVGSITSSCDLSIFTTEKDTKGRWVLTFENCMKIYVENEKTYTTLISLLKLPTKRGMISGKIIFVNGHYNSVTSSVGLSPEIGFKFYWADDFEAKAKAYFKENSDFNLFVDGTTALGGTENGAKRKQRGYNWAKTNADLLLNHMAENGTFKLVGHSEGAAFAAGIAEYLKNERKKEVDEILYLSPDEGNEFASPVGIHAYQILYASYKGGEVGPHYPYDPMVGYYMIKNTTICGAVLRSDLDFSLIHGNTAFESVVFSEISDLKKVKTTKWIDINNKKTFYKQNGGLKTIFLKINNFELEQK